MQTYKEPPDSKAKSMTLSFETFFTLLSFFIFSSLLLNSFCICAVNWAVILYFKSDSVTSVTYINSDWCIAFIFVWDVIYFILKIAIDPATEYETFDSSSSLVVLKYKMWNSCILLCFPGLLNTQVRKHKVFMCSS